MKNSFYIFLLIILITSLSFSQNIWINEFSYNCADDGDEFVEIVAPVGTDMSTYAIVFYVLEGEAYNANAYAQLNGNITSTNSDNGKGFFVVTTNNSNLLNIYNPIPSGIVTQTVMNEMGLTNETGGILLVNHSTGEIIHGVCYELPVSSELPTVVYNKLNEDPQWEEKDFNLVKSPLDAVRLPLIDDGNSFPTGSISMIGTGFSHVWTTTAGSTRSSISTPGALNYSQGALPVELSSFIATVLASAVKLSWRTETEVNNFGFDIERKSAIGSWEKINFVNGCGNSNSPKYYSFVDMSIRNGNYSYRLKQIDSDGKFAYSNVVEITFSNSLDYSLNQNYPNPFNPSTKINFTLPQSGFVKLTVYNLLGQQIKTLINEFKESGLHSINFNASDLNSGIYIYKLESNNFTQTRKMTLIK
ncbi:MAG: T9SS type A sorting domain-containing protein [Ignavibacteriales bacterium]|nr:T9SS type A sorting domain-containing protein [Ignavibacteriales bacterium]